MARVPILPAVVAWLVVAGAWRPARAAETVFVAGGQPKLVREQGRRWTRGKGCLEGGGVGNVLVAGRAVGAGDCHVRVRLKILKMKNSAASFVIGGRSHFGFEGGTGQTFVEGPLFGGKPKFLGPSARFVRGGEAILFEMIRSGRELRFLVDGKEAIRIRRSGGPLGSIGLRPHRGTMQVLDFAMTGNAVVSVRSTLTEIDERAKMLPTLTDVFRSGTDGYHTYRIPAVIVSPKGHLLAFCEGRKHGRGDTGDIDIVMKRSADGGKTWSDMKVIADHGPHVIGNPCPVVDKATATLWMPLTRNRGDEPEGRIMKGGTREPRTVWLMKSADDGHTWTEPANISDTTRAAHWRWYATGPGVGIQLERGPHKGRLLIPCDHSDHDYGKHPYRSHAIFSDDGGKTWRHSPGIGERTNECQAVELADGSVLMNMRSYHGKHRRAVAVSTDGGATWGDVSLDQALVEPVCQASMLRYTAQPGFAKNRILFSNPASTGRDKLTIRLSVDEGKTWPVAKLLYAGSAAYSCLVVLPDHSIGCFFERDGYSKITFARFSLAWLTDGADELKRAGQ